MPPVPVSQVEVDDFASWFTSNLLDPSAVGARIPNWDEWSRSMLDRMRGGKDETRQTAWERRLNQWRVMRPIRYRMTFKDVPPYGGISFDAWQPESDAYIASVSRLLARVGKVRRSPPDDLGAPIIIQESVESRTGLTVEVLCPTPYPTKCTATDRWIRALLRWMTLHELDEYIQINEERPYHPHRNGMTPFPADLGKL